MYISSILSGFSQKPSKLAWLAVKKVFAYLLFDTKNKSLFYKFSSDPRSVSFALDVYVDASLKSPQEKDLKSRSGYVIFVNKNPFTWFSRRQSLTCQSTEEAEVISAKQGRERGLFPRRAGCGWLGR